MPEDSDLVDAFARHSGWFVERSSLRSRRELVSWIGNQLSEKASRQLETLLPLETPAQREAEKALCEVLEAEEAPTRTVRQRRRVNQPTRSVDWAATYARSVWDPPLEYVETQRSPRLDLPVMKALVHQAKVWKATLEPYSQRYEERIGKLEEAIANAASEWKHRTATLDDRKLQRLAQHDRTRAEKIRRGLNLWNGVNDVTSKAFRKAVRAAIDCDDDVYNADMLLEILSAWIIARVLVDDDSDQSARNWEFRDGHPRTARADESDIALALRDVESGLQCEIRACASTRPQDCIPDTEEPRGDVDRLVALRSVSLGDNARGYQPDLTLYFTHTEYDGVLFAFGDAKNYQESDLSTAIKNTGIPYLFAYASLCGLPPEGDDYSPFEIATALRPVVTIFGRKGVDTVLGFDTDDTDKISAAFQNDNTEIPPVVCFGERHYLTVDSGEDTGADVSSAHGHQFSVLKAWFDRLADDAARTFEEGRAIDVENRLYEEGSARPMLGTDE